MHQWLSRDPVSRLQTYLTSAGALDDDADIAAEAERFADDVRTRMNQDVAPAPDELFEHVYAEPTAALRRQRDHLRAELADD